MNLIELLSKIPRKNTSYAGYEENPEFFDEMGEQGVKFRNLPDWLPGEQRPFTIGNTIFQNEEYIDGIQNLSKEGLDYHGLPEDSNENPWQAMAKDEIPHVAQYRNMGLLGFIGQYGKDLFRNKFKQQDMYDDTESLEGFHRNQPDKKNSLLNFGI